MLSQEEVTDITIKEAIVEVVIPSELYELLKQAAQETECSVDVLVQEILQKEVISNKGNKYADIKDDTNQDS